jgi:hypothetical protein
MPKILSAKAAHSLDRDQRLELARDWLTRLGLDVTDERANDLAPHVGRYRAGSLLQKAANALVREGRRPKHAIVQARLSVQRGRDQSRRNSTTPASFEGRKAEAEMWLKRLLPQLLVTDERAMEVARYVDKYVPGSAYHKIAEGLIRARQTPSLEKVRERHQARKAARLRYQARRMERIEQIRITDDLVQELRRIISYSWSRQGRGPLWSEIREAMKWDRDQTTDLLHRLREARTITFTTAHGSLTLPESGANKI